MIARYQDEEIAKLWSLSETYRRWLTIELAAMAVVTGHKEAEQAGAIIAKTFHPGPQFLGELMALAVAKEEKVTRHDVVAFVNVCCRTLETADRMDLSGHFHKRLTSSDVVDTGTAATVKRSGERITSLAQMLHQVIGDRAKEFPQEGVARTHGRAAMAMPWNRRFEYWRQELWTHTMAAAGQRFSLAKISGPTGHQIDSSTEADILHILGLAKVDRDGPIPSHDITIQCVSRVNFFQVMSGWFAVALVAEKIALDVRLLAVQEVGEVNEGYPRKRVGSSSMPHKKNPVNAEKVSGLVRVLRGYLFSLSENAALWMERDISHSSVERIVLPDFFHVLAHILSVLTEVFENLDVNAQAITRNLDAVRTEVGSYDALHQNLSHGRPAAHRDISGRDS